MRYIVCRLVGERRCRGPNARETRGRQKKRNAWVSTQRRCGAAGAGLVPSYLRKMARATRDATLFVCFNARYDKGFWDDVVVR